MLILKKLEMDNFGPFKGYQTLEFPPSGITVIYGENMRGKTKLLNAIRYALFGKVLSRASREESLHLIGNWEAARDGQYGFQVVLHFESDSHDYALTRSYLPREGVDQPLDDRDYVQELFLKRDGIMLGPEQTDTELARIIPEQVARFFLFDGELLQEYEELLRDDSRMGVRITEAIERILGVPILTNARADFRELHRQAQRQASKAAQRDLKTQELGNHLEERHEHRRYLEDEKERSQQELLELEASRASLYQELRKSEKVKVYLDEIDEKRRAVNEREGQLRDRKEDLKDIMTDSWRGLLSQKLHLIEIELRERQQAFQERMELAALTEQVRQSISASVCVVCGQPIDTDTADTMSEHLNELLAGAAHEPDIQRMHDLTYRIRILQGFTAPDRTELVSEVQDSIDNLIVQISDSKDRLNELEEYVEGYDQSAIRAMYADYDRTVKEIGELEHGISDLEQKILETDEAIDRLLEEIRKVSGSDPSRESRKSDMLGLLYQMFDRGVAAYRDQLRSHVEKDATDLFLMLTSEPEYKRLSINDSYGLRIIHTDNAEIPVRSAGAEHIVALSLMGALQRNAPLQGPIVMDSPFGRLDTAHTNNVIGALPRMGDQVILLVYRSELHPEQAREILGGALAAEYRLDRQSARHTILVPNLE